MFLWHSAKFRNNNAKARTSSQASPAKACAGKCHTPFKGDLPALITACRGRRLNLRQAAPPLELAESVGCGIPAHLRPVRRARGKSERFVVRCRLEPEPGHRQAPVRSLLFCLTRPSLSWSLVTSLPGATEWVATVASCHIAQHWPACSPRWPRGRNK